MPMGPQIFVLSGPNGAGKSTTAGILLPEELGVRQFVNADLIAQGLSPFAAEQSAIEAGRLMLRRIHDLRQKRQSFAFETTLAGQIFAPFLREAQDEGYFVHILYIWLSSVELARSRVAARVRQGGHDVPPDVIERRYWRGLINFAKLYQPLADEWTLCNNSGEEPVVIAQGEKGQSPIVYDQAIFDWIQRETADEST